MLWTILHAAATQAAMLEAVATWPWQHRLLCMCFCHEMSGLHLRTSCKVTQESLAPHLEQQLILDFRCVVYSSVLPT